MLGERSLGGGDGHQERDGIRGGERGVGRGTKIRREECDQVRVTPEVSSTTVLRSGRPEKGTGERPVGGQQDPSSILGDKEQCKKAQKNPKKNMDSETMKSNIPIRRPDWTGLLWQPSKKDSLTMS